MLVKAAERRIAPPDDARGRDLTAMAVKPRVEGAPSTERE
jgi:hypothetical protein